MMNSKNILWFNPDRTRYFLIPNDRELSPGEFILCRGVSHQMSVDEIALQPYEITREAARAHLDSQAEHVLDEAKSSVLNFLEQFKLPTPPVPSSPDPAMLENLATGIESLAEALSERLRTKAQSVRNESETTPAEDAD